MALLNENEVVDAIAVHLASCGWEVHQALHGHQRGVDIRATGPDGTHLVVEAKGGTSSRPGSAKYGKPMSPGEVRINIAEAFYTAAVALTQPAVGRSAMGFHDDERHRRFTDPLVAAARALGIGIFWVGDDRQVHLDADWSIDGKSKERLCAKS